MPTDSCAWSILRHECMLKRFRFETNEPRGTNSERQQKLRNVVGLAQFLAGEIVFPTKRHHAALSRITVKLEFAKGKCAQTRDECAFISFVHQITLIAKAFEASR